MDASLLLLEGAKLAIQSYFNYMRVAGKTPEEVDAVYQQEKAQFEKNNPDELEDTPPA